MKRLSARQYAMAIDMALTAPKASVAQIAPRILHRLRRDRAMRLMPRVLEHLRNIESARRGRRRVTIEAATPRAADALADQLTKTDVTVVIRPELRRGVAVIVDDRRIDASLDGRLRQLQQSLLFHA